jgi:hypothetical protein
MKEKTKFFSKINEILLLINLFFLQSYLIRFNLGPYPSNLQEVLIALQGIFFIASKIETKTLGKVIKNIEKHWVILSFIAMTILSLATVATPSTIDMIRHSKFLVFALTLSFIFLETLTKKDEIEKGLKTLGLGAIAFGIFSVIYNLAGINVAYDLRLLGPLDAAVYLGYYLAPFFIFFSIKSLEKPKNKENLVFAIILALLIIATRSMGAIGGTFIVIVLYLFKKHKREILKTRIRKQLVALSIITLLVVIFYSKILPTLTTEYSSLDERGEIWKTSIYLLQNPKNLLLGLGFGQFEYHYIANVDQILGRKALDYYVIQPHNIFLLFIFHYGIIGLFFILTCIYKLIKNINKYETIAAFMLLYLFIHGLIDTPFFKNDMLFIFILLLELALVNKEKSEKNLPRLA